MAFLMAKNGGRGGFLIGLVDRHDNANFLAGDGAPALLPARRIAISVLRKQLPAHILKLALGEADYRNLSGERVVKSGRWVPLRVVKAGESLERAE